MLNGAFGTIRHSWLQAGAKLASLLPRSFKWILHVSRAVIAAIDSMAAICSGKISTGGNGP
jgi:hypothetical protein